MNVLSLFDGVSCGRVALDRVGIKYDKYYASEIDANAMAIAMKNYPDTVQLGDVTKIDGNNLPPIKLLIGGSPCNSLSIAGNGTGFQGQSKLFWEYVRIKNIVKPEYFLLENVSMKQEWQDIISEALGVKPICINSSLVSAQHRKRLYWTNIPNVSQPEDRKLVLKDIMEDFTNWNYDETKKVADKYDITARIKTKPEFHKNKAGFDPETYEFKLRANERTLTHKKAYGNMRTPEQKAKTLTASGQFVSNSGSTNIVIQEINKDGIGGYIRIPTPLECERLQTLTDNFTEGFRDAIRYKVLGNCWTVDIIVHIFKNINHINQENEMNEQNTTVEPAVKTPNDNILAILSRQMSEKNDDKLMKDKSNPAASDNAGIQIPNVKVVTPCGIKTVTGLVDGNDAAYTVGSPLPENTALTFKVDKPTTVPAGSVSSVPGTSTTCGHSCTCNEKKRTRTASIDIVRTASEAFINRTTNMKNRLESIFSEFINKAEKVDSSLNELNGIEGCSDIPEMEAMKQTVFDSLQKAMVKSLVDAMQNCEYDIPVIDGDATTVDSYINASQAAKMYGCSSNTMIGWLKNGIVKGYINVKNGRNMILKADVEKLMAKKAEVIPGVN
jgi:DNA (cytosine-5)-methyltransferase 3A